MRTIYRLFLSLLAMACLQPLAAKDTSITSPDGHLKVVVRLADAITYSVYADNDCLLKDCALSLTTGQQTLGLKPALKSQKRTTINEDIKREVPIKNAVVKNHCNALRLNFKGDYSVEFRAYDDGVAYRFITTRKGRIKVTDEAVDLNLTENNLITLSPTKGFETSCEVPYKHVPADEYKPADEMTYLPVYMQTPSGYNILMSESDLRDYPGLFLRSAGNRCLRSAFPKYPLKTKQVNDRQMFASEEAAYIADTDGTRSFPWRFFVIARDARRIVANEMEFRLAGPCELTDTDWIKPGQVSWDWWNRWTLWDVDFVAGCNEETYKYYIDFAAKYKIPYMLLDEGWAVSTADPFHANKDTDIARLIAYAKSKGVGIVLWLTWLETERNFNLFAEYEKWGVAGVKIDFMDRQDQPMVNFYERVVKEAARHHLFVDFHGAYKPAGLERRYPNLLSYEGVRGLENGGGCYPANTNWLPFVRNAVGPMDFTPGGMVNVQPQFNHSTDAIAMASGTRAYQMGLYVICESGLQMLSDCPKRYEQWPDCTQWMTSVPVTWDESRVLLAEPGKYVVIARRKGTQWFVGAINDGTERDLTFPLDFLGTGSHTMTAFKDGRNANHYAIDYRRTEEQVAATDTYTVHVAQNGGFAAVIK